MKKSMLVVFSVSFLFGVALASDLKPTQEEARMHLNCLQGKANCPVDSCRNKKFKYCLSDLNKGKKYNLGGVTPYDQCINDCEKMCDADPSGCPDCAAICAPYLPN